MNFSPTPTSSQFDLALTAIGERYGALRLISPMAENRMLRSVERYGQLAPVVVNRNPDDHYELLDGFKRLRAAKKLGRPSLRARVVAVGEHGGKAALLLLNWAGKTVSELEEALVVQALCREDGLQQKEVAALLERHKSWVSRRLGLVERLSEEVQEALRLGLVTASNARELAKLPRGNQAKALAAIEKHRLTFRETARLVADLIAEPRWNQEAILRCEAILAQRIAPCRQGRRVCKEETGILAQRLLAMTNACLAVTEWIASERNGDIGMGEREGLAPLINRAIGVAETAIASLTTHIAAGEITG